MTGWGSGSLLGCTFSQGSDAPLRSFLSSSPPRASYSPLFPLLSCPHFSSSPSRPLFFSSLCLLSVPPQAPRPRPPEPRRCLSSSRSGPDSVARTRSRSETSPSPRRHHLCRRRGWLVPSESGWRGHGTTHSSGATLVWLRSAGCRSAGRRPATEQTAAAPALLRRLQRLQRLQRP